MLLCVGERGRYKDFQGNRTNKTIQRFEIRPDSDKYINTLTTVEKDNYIIVVEKENC